MFNTNINIGILPRELGEFDQDEKIAVEIKNEIKDYGLEKNPSR